MAKMIGLLLFILQNIVLILLFYRVIYFFVSAFSNDRAPSAKKNHRYALLIYASDAEKLIGQIIKSIRQQKYPESRYKIFVVADNCADRTALAALSEGAVVYERHDADHCRPGHGFNYLVSKIRKDYGFNSFDGFGFFTADLLLHPNYLKEINKYFDAGYTYITPYRCSKNFSASWVSAVSSLHSIVRCEQTDCARTHLGLASAANGFGFVVSRGILKRYDGWKYFLSDEALESSVSAIVRGENIVFAKNAIVFEEHPFFFAESWELRMHQIKGGYQALRKGLKNLISSGAGFSGFDTVLTLSSGFLFLISLVLLLFSARVSYPFGTAEYAVRILQAFLKYIVFFYILFLISAFSAVRKAKKRIRCRKGLLAAYILVYPFYVISYVPIIVISIFSPARRRPVFHRMKTDIDDYVRRK